MPHCLVVECVDDLVDDPSRDAKILICHLDHALKLFSTVGLKKEGEFVVLLIQTSCQSPGLCFDLEQTTIGDRMERRISD